MTTDVSVLSLDCPVQWSVLSGLKTDGVNNGIVCCYQVAPRPLAVTHQALVTAWSPTVNRKT